ncbi:MAG: hypothetical protein J0M04_16490 [Verrucomicrobia bacterium]|nr:hypothetical protein [Verrucomicrobiota bacterium]
MIPFSFTGNAGSTLSHVVVPAGGRDRIRVQYVSATSDKATSLILFKTSTKSAAVTATGAANQAVVSCVPYAGAAANDVVVLFSKVSGTGVRGVVTSVQAGASITLTANLGLAMAPGDTVHLMTAAGQVPVGAATKEINAPTVFVVHEGPALIELDGTAACRVNLVAGEYS